MKCEDPIRGVGRTPSEEFIAALSNGISLGDCGDAVDANGKPATRPIPTAEEKEMQTKAKIQEMKARAEAHKSFTRKVPARSCSTDSGDFNDAFFTEHQQDKDDTPKQSSWRETDSIRGM